ncbi:MAG: hypothetical protein FGM28_02470 [Limnohabitans sp.]|nr:hypothetical protein [Limnohabitans sp.]
MMTDSMNTPSSELHCPLCANPCVQEMYETNTRMGRRNYKVEKLLMWVCQSCQFEFEDEAQSAHNLSLFEQVTAEEPGAVTPGLMRKLRRIWGLTQAQASALFGAGSTSFAKWESEQTKPSRPSALLLQAAFHVPQVMQFLAKLAKVDLPQPADPNFLNVLQHSSSAYAPLELPYDTTEPFDFWSHVDPLSPSPANDASYKSAASLARHEASWQSTWTTSPELTQRTA